MAKITDVKGMPLTDEELREANIIGMAINMLYAINAIARIGILLDAPP